MSDAFVAYIRHEEKVLLMQRADEVSDFPGAWDGVYGVGDSNDLDVVASRIEEATGIPHESLTFIDFTCASALAAMPLAAVGGGGRVGSDRGWGPSGTASRLSVEG